MEPKEPFKEPFDRRHFLYAVGITSTGLAAPAADAAPSLRTGGPEPSVQVLPQLADYAGIAMSPERAQQIAPQVQAMVAALRRNWPADDIDLEPSIAFRPGE
jgi:hypothetical protein